MNTNFDIEKFLDLKDYATKERVERRKNQNSNEFFTPYSLIKKMADNLSENMWSDPTKTFLEPCFGNGNMVCYILYRKIINGSTVYQALTTTYGVELFESNVIETYSRITDMFEFMGLEYDIDKVYDIMVQNLVCSDFFRWNCEEWRPYTEEEFAKTEYGKNLLKKNKSKK